MRFRIGPLRSRTASLPEVDDFGVGAFAASFIWNPERIIRQLLKEVPPPPKKKQNGVLVVPK